MYLAVFDGSGWRMEREALLSLLIRDWPEAVLHPPGYGGSSPEVSDIVWDYSDEDRSLSASSHADGTCLYLDGDLTLAARFALWYRGLVPGGIDVVFCNESYTFDVSMNSSTSIEDLVSAAA